ncbi:hypothetical protein [Segatella copri]|uniref:hypothetical protein n=1 Tax=Segatella copri TaxID=165179 RepID=UPI00346190E5
MPPSFTCGSSTGFVLSRILGLGYIIGKSGYFSLNLSDNSVMRGRVHARRTLKGLVADLRSFICNLAFLIC